jgi:hypothetical protein
MRRLGGYQVVMFEDRIFGQIVILDTQNLNHHSPNHLGVQIESQGSPTLKQLRSSYSRFIRPAQFQLNASGRQLLSMNPNKESFIVSPNTVLSILENSPIICPSYVNVSNKDVRVTDLGVAFMSNDNPASVSGDEPIGQKLRSTFQSSFLK